MITVMRVSTIYGTCFFTPLRYFSKQTVWEIIKLSVSINTGKVRDGKGYLAYVTEALSNMRFASIIISILFVLVVIIAFFNMLVTLAVMGGEELREYGQTYHPCNHVQLLYEWQKALRVLDRIRDAQSDE
jgi:hypothetical protein